MKWRHINKLGECLHCSWEWFLTTEEIRLFKATEVVNSKGKPFLHLFLRNNVIDVMTLRGLLGINGQNTVDFCKFKSVR